MNIWNGTVDTTDSKSMKIVKQSNVSLVDECVDLLVQQVKEEVNNIPLSRDYDLCRFTLHMTIRCGTLARHS